ncbi:protein phosphatase 2C domain-containing protein [Actinoplanes sp. LDG1-06]|uniref:Protein phosphatase 2C domain-containing protein n=1 Tax=Paractinoplanes ovalisporus TaxID=2810368 RepID=A0ABS2ATL5_9ACTN|nr:protein phosphatase 2C domain-containing protein [Actinoplanes ovalisporus]MBM2623212.1 protein phosphatase 2C domain-containing protein [Actinoplanes ovalisporus]
MIRRSLHRLGLGDPDGPGVTGTQAHEGGQRAAPGPVSEFGRPLPVVLGEPITPAREDASLSVTSWTTQSQISADGGTHGPLTVRAASVCGRKHASHGGTREDSYALGRAQDCVVVTVADGVGSSSARYSAVGARIAAVEACRLGMEAVDNNRGMDAADLCRGVSAAMSARAGSFVRGGWDEQSLATTLAMAWVCSDGSFTGLQVGDGRIYRLTEGGFEPNGSDPDGPYDRTDSLPGSENAVRKFSGRLRPGSALVVVTDGLSGAMASAEVSAHLTRCWAGVPTVAGFLHDVSFQRRGESDDRTAVGVWFKPTAVDW